MPPLTLWISKASPPANAVRMLADLLGLTLELKEPNLLGREHKSEDFRRMNPMGTVPTLQDGNFVVSESHAIVTYLVEKYGGEMKSTLYPFDLETRAIIQERMYYNAGVFFLRLKVVALPAFFQGSSGATPAQLEDIDEAYGTLERYLSRSRYIAADHLTVADLCMVSTAAAIQAIRPVDKEKFPKVNDWLESFEQEPCFAKHMRPGADLFGKLLNMVWAKNKDTSENTQQ